MSCLPLLERPYGDVTDDLARTTGVSSAAIRSATSRLVPGGVVEAALFIGTDYWLRGVCGWLAALTPSEQTAAWAFRIRERGGCGPVDEPCGPASAEELAAGPAVEARVTSGLCTRGSWDLSPGYRGARPAECRREGW